MLTEHPIVCVTGKLSNCEEKTASANKNEKVLIPALSISKACKHAKKH